VGQQKKAAIEAVHTLGWTEGLVKAYIRDALMQFLQNFVVTFFYHSGKNKFSNPYPIRILAKILQTKKSVQELSLKAMQDKRFQVLISFLLTQSDKRELSPLR
jgi:hypothetical protein